MLVSKIACVFSLSPHNLYNQTMDTFSYLLSGALFGIVAGITPGPLLIYVITQTMRHDRKVGFLLATVPVYTDFPIVCLSVFLLAKISSYSYILGAISIAGALFICWLSYESITAKGVEIETAKKGERSLRKGVVNNLLNPHPYIFWITVGAPNTLKANQHSLLSAVLFVLGFYLLLVGSKIVVVLIVDRSKTFLKSRVYIYIIKALGASLLLFAVLFFRDGLKLLGLFE
jgi:threonine/homoserine/homoserine lactone efflux protein